MDVNIRYTRDDENERKIIYLFESRDKLLRVKMNIK